MNSDYMDFKELQASRAFHKLQALWAHEGVRIMDALQRAASKGQESAWRYYAGQMKGFDLAITHLERAILQMEKEGEGDTPATKTVEELLNEIKGNGEGK